MSLTRTAIAAAVLCSFAVASCKRSDAGAHAEERASGSPLQRAKQLALAPPTGSATVDTAIAQLQVLIKNKPLDPDAWSALGRAWISKARTTGDAGYYLNADACALVLLERQPDLTAALQLRSMVLLNQHRFEEARVLAEKIIARAPGDPVTYAVQSDALLELGRFEEASKAVQTMIDLKPNLPSYARAAHLRWLQGDWKTARDLYKSAISSGIDPRDPEPQAWTIVQAATLFFQAGDDEGADAGADLALQRVPGYAPALVLKGRTALARRDPGNAIRHLDAAFKASPGVETAWLLGDARLLAGDRTGADAAYAYVESKGRLADPRTLSLFWSTKNTHPGEALALAEEERKIRGDLYTEDALAWALHRNARDAEAKVAIDRALRLGTREARLLYHAGAIRIALGDRDSGRKMVGEAVALRPNFDATEGPEAQRIATGG